MRAGLRGRLVALAAIAAAACARPSRASEWWVSPSGTSSTAPGTGTRDAPWSLAAALAQPPQVQPGDTIWVEAGTYAGTFASALRGTGTAPIVVRAVPGARATIDGGDSKGAAILVVGGAHTWYWGLEVTSSDPVRASVQDGPWPGDLGRGEGVQILQTEGSGVGTKFIDMVVHDTRQGFSFWKEAVDAEICGSLVYFNGWTSPGGAHGHGVYVQNEEGTKLLEDDIVFRNFSHGFHAYGTKSVHLDHIRYVGNTVFSNGEPGGTFDRNLLTGGGNVAEAPEWTGNMTWSPPPYGTNELGFDAGCENAVVRDNYLVGASKAITIASCTAGLTMSGNAFIGRYAPDGFAPSEFPANSFVDGAPPLDPVQVFVRPNRYEPGRANITVYAWDGRGSVDVDVSGILAAGAIYQVRDAQDFFGPPVVWARYAGGPITIPLGPRPGAAPVGMAPLPPTGPAFNAFVLVPTTVPPPPAEVAGPFRHGGLP